MRFPFARYPAVRLALVCIAGILLSDGFSWLVSLGLCIGSMACSMLLHARSGILWARALGNMFFLSAFFFFSVTWTHLHSSATKSSQWMPDDEVLYLEPLDIEGIITSVKHTERNVRIVMKAQAFVFAQGDTLRLNEHIMLRAVGAFPRSHFRKGDYLNVHAALEPIPVQRNPSDFNTAQWLGYLGVRWQGKMLHVKEQHQHTKRWEWSYWQNLIDEVLYQRLNADRSPLVKALILGDKSDLLWEERQVFARAGLSHLMAVSGLHVGFVVAPLWVIILRIRTKKYGAIIGMTILGVVLFCYAGLTGFPSSVMRASLMAFLLLYGQLFQKMRDPLNIMAVAALIILLIQPSQVYDLGFQLSFAAVGILLLLAPRLSEMWLQAYRERWFYPVLSIVSMTILVQLGLLPVLAYYFNEVSVIAPISNLGAIVVTQLLVISTFASLLVYPLLHPLADLLFWIPGSLAFVLHEIARFTSSLPGAYVSVPKPAPLQFFAWFALLGLYASTGVKGRWPKWAILFLSLLAAHHVMQLLSAKQHTGQSLLVDVLDVGQGDAILIHTPSGKTMLYDTGPRWLGWDAGERILVPELRHRNVDTLHAVVLSHPHADHIGGFMALARRFPIRQVYHTAQPYESKMADEYRRFCAEKGIPITEVQGGDELVLDEHVKIHVLWPMKAFQHKNVNNVSLTVRVQYGEASMLLSGDAEEEAEEWMTELWGDLLKADVYKAGHHGSKTSSTQKMLDAVQPKIAVVSLGMVNRYRHPHREALERLNAVADTVHFTATEGMIRFVSDGTSFRQVPWRN